MRNSLVNKYNVAGPRYTSYPTVPFWDTENFRLKQWKAEVSNSFSKTNNHGISLYIHLPFCESMCTFCGCTKRITKRHDVETSYINALIKEWNLYLDLFHGRPVIKELHLGGGTPTFFSPENLKLLIDGLFRHADKSPIFEFSFEGHPNNTTKEHLQVLFDLGFTRVSYGVQDYNETIQKAINRVQPIEHVKFATEAARDIGYSSIGHDIIFGLPFQTEAHIRQTIEKTKQLLPDRLAFYSYAHVPWINGNGQRGFRDEDLPSGASKREMYVIGKQLLEEIGYSEIGMDHFALPTDSLYKSMATGDLHRNFMGYTVSKTKAMIGLGVSAISDIWHSYAQNVKSLESYYSLLNSNILPIFRGHHLTREDLIIRKHIFNLMCQFKTSWEDKELYFDELPDVLIRLCEMEHDGLVQCHSKSIEVTESGRPYIRNVCMAFDLLLQRKKPETKLFSMII